MDDFAADLPPEVSDRCADSDAGYDLRIDSTQLTVVECADILRASLPQGWRLPDRR